MMSLRSSVDGVSFKSMRLAFEPVKEGATISSRKSKEATASRSLSPYRTKKSSPRPMIDGLDEPQVDGNRNTRCAWAADAEKSSAAGQHASDLT